jgi:hypothetical protein
LALFFKYFYSFIKCFNSCSFHLDFLKENFNKIVSDLPWNHFLSRVSPSTFDLYHYLACKYSCSWVS